MKLRRANAHVHCTALHCSKQFGGALVAQQEAVYTVHDKLHLSPIKGNRLYLYIAFSKVLFIHSVMQCAGLTIRGNLGSVSCSRILQHVDSKSQIEPPCDKWTTCSTILLLKMNVMSTICGSGPHIPLSYKNILGKQLMCTVF